MRHSHGCVDPASPRERHGAISWIVSTSKSPVPGVAAFIGFAAQVKPVRFESAGAPLRFGFNPGDAMSGMQGIGV